MTNKIKGFILYNLYLKKNNLFILLVLIIYFFSLLSKDLKSEGAEQIGTSINVFGFTSLYCVSVFTSYFFKAEKNFKFTTYLKTINSGLQSFAVTKYTTDLAFTLANTLILTVAILVFLLKNGIAPELNYFMGIVWAFECVLFCCGLDNMIKLIYNKPWQKIIISLLVGLMLFFFCIVFISFPMLLNIKLIGILLISAINIIIYICLCIFVKNKIANNYMEDN